MQGRVDDWFRSPLLSPLKPEATRGRRLVILLLWVAVTGWLAAHHVPWRDEVRAWSLMRLADSWPDLFRVVHGEGHPYLWYVLLRAGNQLFGVREVLPALGLLIGAAAVVLLALKSPFRLGVIAVLLFSMHLGFEYSVVSRNYGMSALILFVIAATYPRVKDSPWFGVQLLLLCNSNAPSVFLAGALFLYRLIEVATERPRLRSRTTTMLLVNGTLLLGGVVLCFLAVFPTVNDAAAASSKVPLSIGNLLIAIADSGRSFSSLGIDNPLVATAAMLLCICYFWRDKPALLAALAAFLVMKLFFFFVYPAAYRHAALFMMLLVALAWMGAGQQKPEFERPLQEGLLPLLTAWVFVVVLAMQTVLYVRWPVMATIQGRPWSNAANLAAVLRQPENTGAIVMFDPDAVGESLVYYTGQPFWQLRQSRFGTVVPFSLSGRRQLSFGEVTTDAVQLHQRTGRPILIVLQRDLKRVKPGRYDVMYGATTDYSRENVAQFLAVTRQVASLRNAYSDENYDVYRYPR